VGHPGHYDTLALVGRSCDTLRTGRGQREGLLDQDVEVSRQRRENVRFMEVIGGGDQDGVELFVRQEILEIVVDARNPAALRQRARLLKSTSQSAAILTPRVLRSTGR